MEVTKVERKYRLTHHDLVKYQVMTEFVFFRKEQLSDADVDLLTLLALTGPVELTKFCSIVVKQSSEKIFLAQGKKNIGVADILQRDSSIVEFSIGGV